MTENIHEYPYEENAEKTVGLLNTMTKKRMPNLNMRSKEVSYVYEDESGVLGRIVGDIFWDTLSLRFFYVDKDARGKGVGSKLLEKVEQIALEHDCKHVTLESMSFNSWKFYLGRGYEVMAKIEDSPCEGETHYFLRKDF